MLNSQRFHRCISSWISNQWIKLSRDLYAFHWRNIEFGRKNPEKLDAWDQDIAVHLSRSEIEGMEQTFRRNARMLQELLIQTIAATKVSSNENRDRRSGEIRSFA